MERKAASGIMLTILLTSILMLMFNIQPVEASGTVYIRADGSIDPPTAPIQRDGHIYTFTANINDSIVVQRDNIVIDGNGCTIQGIGAGYGFNLEYRKNVTIKNTTIKGFSSGIRLFRSRGNIIAGNHITDNVLDGIWVAYSSSDNKITNNNINKNGWHGIDVEVSTSNTIVGNNIFKNSWHGIYLYYSSGNVLRDNALTENWGNFYVYSDRVSDFIQNIDTSNSVNGKPIYYLVNRSNEQVPSDPGYVGLVNCVNISVRDLNLGNDGAGVLLANTNSSWIMNVSNSKEAQNGIYLYHSYNNTISDNTLRNPGEAALYLYYSSYNTLTCNKIIENNWRGIYLSYSSANTITYNTMVNNLYGMDVYESNNNLVHNNNFINNTFQAEVRSSELVNVWDNGYPSGGNYWSDYTGVDLYRDPFQNETGSDGIIDTSYIFYADNQDRFPLKKPYGGANDIGITNIAVSKTVIGQGYSLSINVKLVNYGINTETFDVTAYANTTIIAELTNRTLTSRNSATVTFTWNTSGFAKGNYTISAHAEPVLGETDTTDNTYTDGTVRVVTPGDVNGDGVVNIGDVGGISAHWYPGPPIGPLGYDPNFDINGDGAVNIADVGILSVNWGQTVP